MARQPKEPLRTLTSEEKQQLEQFSRARSEPAAVVTRAKLILAVSQGMNFTEAAHSMGRLSGDAVARLICRFNQEGLEALAPRHGGGPVVLYGPEARARILAEFTRSPDREQDGTATWSMSTLQRALRRAPDGLPNVSTYTILQVLHEAGYTYQADRTWCHTGRVLRQRKSGVVEVTDPDAEAKRSPHPARLR